MSGIWTSNLDEFANFDDAYRRVCAGFIVRRGRGAALSAADTDALDSWLREGYSWLEILLAIDAAFAKLRSAPSSLRACGKFLPKRSTNDELLDPRILAAAFGASVPDAFGQSTPSTYSPSKEAARVLRVSLAEATHPIAKIAYQQLLEEIEERESTQPIDEETVALLDEALALLALEAMPEARRQAIESFIEKAPKTLRTRTMLECVGQEIDLIYPNLGKLH